MADETTQQAQQGTQAAPQAPQLDLTALQTMMNQTLQQGLREGVRTSLREIAEENQQTQSQRQVQQQQAEDPMLKVIGPYVGPAMVHAQDAIDAATFYPTTAEAAPYRDEVERIAAAWRAQGRAMPRQEIWLYVQGLHRKELTEASIKERDDAAERARLASTVGLGSPDRQLGGTTDPYSMSIDELTKALDGVSF